MLIASCGTTRARGKVASATVTSTSWPGTRLESVLGKVARSSIVPVVLLTALPTKSTGACNSLAFASCRSTDAASLPLLQRSWIRGRSDCASENDTFTGWIWVMTTSGLALVPLPVVVAADVAVLVVPVGLVLLPPPLVTMLPGWIMIGPVLPSMGERIVV